MARFGYPTARAFSKAVERKTVRHPRSGFLPGVDDLP